MSTVLEQISLTAEETRLFRDQGFLGPFALCQPEDMEGLRRSIEQDVLSHEGPSGNRFQSRHLDKRVVFDLCSHPAVIGRMQSLYGPDLVLWRSHFFCKQPGDKEIPWHQDAAYWPLEPFINITAWLAIDDVRRENACPEFIPGSHKAVLPTIPSPPEMQFSRMADPAQFDASRAVPVEMKPGEFILFNERTLHRSPPNSSRQRRLGLAVRVTIPIVKVDHAQLFPAHRVIQLTGNDSMKLNKTANPPV